MYNMLIFMFEYCHNKLPPSFQSMSMYNHGLNTLRKTRQSDFLYIKYCKSAFAQKLPLYCFPSVWNKWITTTINVKSKSQFKQVVKSKMLASYSNSVHCANLHCTDCHGQSVYTLLAKKLWDRSFVGKNLDLIHSHFNMYGFRSYLFLYIIK